MLINSKGQKVNMPAHFNSTGNAKMFAPLREVLEPETNSCGNMFHLEERARVIDQRK